MPPPAMKLSTESKKNGKFLSDMRLYNGGKRKSAPISSRVIGVIYKKITCSFKSFAMAVQKLGQIFCIRAARKTGLPLFHVVTNWVPPFISAGGIMDI